MIDIVAKYVMDDRVNVPITVNIYHIFLDMLLVIGKVCDLDIDFQAILRLTNLYVFRPKRRRSITRSTDNSNMIFHVFFWTIPSVGVSVVRVDEICHRYDLCIYIGNLERNAALSALREEAERELLSAETSQHIGAFLIAKLIATCALGERPSYPDIVKLSNNGFHA